MSLGVLLLVLNVVLIVHTAKTGRFWPWAYVIFFLPLVGGVAYIIAELLPEWLGSYKGQQARQHVATALNPQGRYRRLRDGVLIADTIANRSALAEECLALGKFDEAFVQYETILARPLADDPIFMLGKARAEFGMNQPAAAAATLDELRRRWPEYRSADGHLLYAIALERAGRHDDALRQYDSVSRYYPGAEPRVRQAELLQRLERADEARALAEDVVRTLKHAPGYIRRGQREWLAMAQKIARS